MLKSGLPPFLLLILLLMNGDIPPFLANIMAVLAGLSLKTVPDLIKGLITLKDFFIRITQIFGLVTIGVLIWQDQDIKKGMIYYLFGVTLFAEFIVYLLIKHGKRWLEKKAKNIDNDE